MDYKTLLVNVKAYSKISKAKEMLSKRLGQGLSFSDVINETLGKSAEFLDTDESLGVYVKTVAEMLGKIESVLGVMLFGSVAKGAYKQYSDIDVFIVIGGEEDKSAMLRHLYKIQKNLEDDGMSLFREALPSSISPLIRRREELDNFLPIYLDLLDYGIVLYDYKSTLANFLNKIRKIKHEREYTQYGEVVRWQR